MSRRCGLLRPGLVTRCVAVVLAVGLVAGFTLPYLVQAGVPLWTGVLLSLVVLAVPVIAVVRADREQR